MVMKKKLLVFHRALAPYRIDLFNELNEAFETDIYFFRKNLRSQNFNMKRIEEQLNFQLKFLTFGYDFRHSGRMIRFGYLKKILHHKPDILICLEFNLITFFSALFTKIILPKTKVYTLCDDSVDVAENCSKIRKTGRILCFLLLDGIVLGNDFAEEWYNKHFPKIKTIVSPIIQKEERIRRIMNEGHSISDKYIDKYHLQGKNILLFVGRLVNVKNLKFLLEVFSQYVSENKNTFLILVGDGEMKTELIGISEKLKIEEYVIFAGRFENEALYAWYRVADYFILPSTSETFGAVVNESLIAGVPVICSNLAGASCMINELNGVTFNPYDQENLLAIFNEKFSTKKNTLSLQDSLMPYTFKERISELITFLNE